MRLTELDPHWLVREDDNHFGRARRLDQADGIRFRCPKCFEVNRGVRGTHSIICWQPHVPQSTFPTPGRWSFRGRGFRDLSLIASSNSVRLTSGCAAHFWIKNGEVTPCSPGWR
jgi:hypothetical protein